MSESLLDFYKRLATESRLDACSYGSKAVGMLYAHEILSIWELGDSPAALNIAEQAARFGELAARAGGEALSFEEHIRSEGGRMRTLDRALLASGFSEGEA